MAEAFLWQYEQKPQEVGVHPVLGDLQRRVTMQPELPPGVQPVSPVAPSFPVFYRDADGVTVMGPSGSFRMASLGPLGSVFKQEDEGCDALPPAD